MTAILLPLPAWTIAPLLLANFLAGVALGRFYFGMVWRSAQRLAFGGSVPALLVLGLGRLALVALVLVLASREGALPLLLVAAGVLFARVHIMRQVREGSA